MRSRLSHLRRARPTLLPCARVRDRAAWSRVAGARHHAARRARDGAQGHAFKTSDSYPLQCAPSPPHPRIMLISYQLLRPSSARAPDARRRPRRTALAALHLLVDPVRRAPSPMLNVPPALVAELRLARAPSPTPGCAALPRRCHAPRRARRHAHIRVRDASAARAEHQGRNRPGTRGRAASARWHARDATPKSRGARRRLVPRARRAMS
jgi:hypothetical protein